MECDLILQHPPLKEKNISVQSLILNEFHNLKERNVPEIGISVQLFEVINDPRDRMFLCFSIPIFVILLNHVQCFWSWKMCMCYNVPSVRMFTLVVRIFLLS